MASSKGNKRARLVGEAAQQTFPALDADTSDKKLEFFLTASHQLKSPVAIIQWCLQSVQELPEVSGEARKLVGKALEQADGMSHLIQDMLQVFRLMRGDHEHTLEPVSLNKVIDTVLEQYELVAHNRQVHLVRGVIENLPQIYANETLVKQALVNIVDNAIKYTKEGGKVSIGSLWKSGYAVIHVADEGIGIPESEQGRIFTEFFRGQEARDIAYEGTGLGLVLVKHIVESFGGDVHFKSELHKGTTFTLRFPCKG